LSQLNQRNHPHTGNAPYVLLTSEPIEILADTAAERRDVLASARSSFVSEQECVVVTGDHHFE
jgi:hypothetical protein